MTGAPRLIVYTYCLLDRAGRVCELELEGCRDDRAASVAAREVLARHPGRIAVEVRRSGDLICPIVRGAPQSAR